MYQQLKAELGFNDDDQQNVALVHKWSSSYTRAHITPGGLQDVFGMTRWPLYTGGI